MPDYSATIETPLSVEEAFAYMVEFSHTSEWDPNCETAEKVGSEDPAVGTRFRLEFSGGPGSDLELNYEITELEAPRRFVLVADEDSLKSVDTVEVEPEGTGSRITYTAQLELKGLRKVATPFLGMGLSKAGSDARKGLAERLGGRAVD